MSRFRWLEMGDEARPGDPHAADTVPGAADMDEATCLARANEYLRRGYYESALQWYSRALRYAIDLEEAWLGQVRCLLELGENAEANIWADRGLERFPNSPDLLAAKAMALGRTRGVARGMEYSDASLSVKGTKVGPYPWIVRGDLLLNGGSAKENAERCFSKSIEVGGDWYTQYLIGMSYSRRGLHEKALRRLSRAVGMERANPMLHCAVAECHERLGEVGGAILAYNKALSVDPRCRRAKQRLAELGRVGPLRRLWRRLRGRG